ncbi:rhodanese-like domain-containing protein [uncultured Eudoraea sp.]|uniref:rhodanese-like domain-containing protein n=1 Tax=uncultured Eudoraea sp. TaxID=1035614 RepID=UPI002605431B|nr:rhodanese-like domain-containing protein [uncultured Eudoraea sp.]
MNFPLIPENKKIKVLDNYYLDECESTNSISSEEFFELLESSEPIQLIDVRSKEEYAQNNIANSINIPFESLETRIQEIDLTLPLYIICQSGIRSRIAQQKLLRHNSTSFIYNILGGINQYNTLLI